MRLLEIRKPLMTGSDVRHLQRLLRAAGMKPGPLDGEFGPRTAAACNHYKWRIGYAPGSCHGQINLFENLVKKADIIAPGHLLVYPCVNADIVHS